MMQTVLLSMRDDNFEEYNEYRSGISHDWVDWLTPIKLQPIMFPNGTFPGAALLKRIDPVALILTGGNDTMPVSDKDGGGDFSLRREQTEDVLIRWALESKTPIFGVCRGLQKLNLFFGGTVKPRLDQNYADHIASTHEVALFGSFVDWAGTESVTVNSYHSQAVCLNDLASDLTVGALSPDGLVEGLYHPDLPIIAVQWHPERGQGQSVLSAMLLNMLTTSQSR